MTRAPLLLALIVWSMFGLIQALEAQGKDASDVQQRFDSVWARVDVTLTASKF